MIRRRVTHLRRGGRRRCRIFRDQLAARIDKHGRLARRRHLLFDTLALAVIRILRDHDAVRIPHFRLLVVAIERERAYTARYSVDVRDDIAILVMSLADRMLFGFNQTLLSQDR